MFETKLKQEHPAKQVECHTHYILLQSVSTISACITRTGCFSLSTNIDTKHILVLVEACLCVCYAGFLLCSKHKSRIDEPNRKKTV